MRANKIAFVIKKRKKEDKENYRFISWHLRFASESIHLALRHAISKYDYLE